MSKRASSAPSASSSTPPPEYISTIMFYSLMRRIKQTGQNRQDPKDWHVMFSKTGLPEHKVDRGISPLYLPYGVRRERRAVSEIVHG